MGLKPVGLPNQPLNLPLPQRWLCCILLTASPTDHQERAPEGGLNYQVKEGIKACQKLSI